MFTGSSFPGARNEVNGDNMKGQSKNQKDHFSDYTFSVFFDNYPYPIIEVSPESHILNANPACIQTFKTTLQELKNHTLTQYIICEEKERIINYLQKETGSIKTSIKIGNQTPIPAEMTVNRINNPELKTLLIHFKLISDKGGSKHRDNHKASPKKERIAGLQSQIAEREAMIQKLQNKLKLQKENHKEIRKSEEKFRNFIEMLPEMVFEVDRHGNITFINQRGMQMLGYTRKELLDKKTIWQLIRRTGNKKIKSDMEALFQKEKNYPQEYYLIRKDQVKIPVEIHGSPIRNDDGELTGFRGIILDITERKEYEDKIKYLSFHDKLTDLYNRAYFEEELKRLNHKRNLPVSIIIGDVNNLKIINDTFGHQHGDHLLCKIAGVLKSCFRKSDVISRWGGDEFSIILPNTPRDRGIDIIHRISQDCQKKSTLTLPLSISMGIATKMSMPDNINAIVREAESKMYRYKLIDKQVADSNIVTSLERALQQKKYETKEYRQSFVNCALQFGTILQLEKDQLNDLKLLAMICDVGKIAVSEAIILKKGWLSENEWEEIRKHPEVGFRIARSSPELTNIADAILYHHEFWNGDGYPQRIKGEDIPLLSRIIHIVNAYQAMTHERPYRKAMNKENAIKELRKGQGSQFDPELTDKFIMMVSQSQK